MARTLDALIVELRADIKGLQAGLRTATGEVQKFSGTAERQVGAVSAAIATAQRAFIAFGGAWAAFRIGQNVFNAGVQMDALRGKMLAATGSAEASAEAMAYVRRESERLGLRFLNAADSFGSFAASATRAGLTLQQTQEIFTGVSEAAVAMRLSNERVNLVFQALSQIAAKGVVSMEELRQQLGESLPIAMEAAARGMGVTQAELIKMIERGEVASADFLPRFGKAIRENLGDAVTMASRSAQANLNRVTNSVDQLKASVAEGGFMFALSEAFKAVNEAVNTPALRSGLTIIGQIIGGIVIFVTQAIAGLAIMIQKLVDLGNRARSFLGLTGRATPPAAQRSGGLVTSGSGFIQDRYMQVLNPKSANEEPDSKTFLADKAKSLGELFELEQGYRDQSLEASAAYYASLGEMRMLDRDGQVSDAQSAWEGFLDVEFAGRQRSLRDQASYFRSTIQQAATHNKTFFALEKAAAIARALIEARESVVSAYKFGTRLGGPALGAAFAGVAAAAQAANIAAIASTSFGNGGAVSASGGAAGSTGASDPRDDLGRPLSNSAPKQVIINLQGNDDTLFSKNTVRQLIEQINDAVGDGSRLVVVAR